MKSSTTSLYAEDLINEVRSRPELWDSTNPKYKNRTIRPKIWREIASKLYLMESESSSLKSRWENIRATYFRSKKLSRSGSSRQGKSYKYARSLSFLDDDIEPRTSMSTEENDEFEISTPKSVSENKYKFEKLELQRQAVSLIEEKASASTEASTASLSAEQYFCNYLYKEMEKLSETDKAELQKEIMLCLCKVKANKN